MVELGVFQPIWVKWQIKAYFYPNPSINFLFEEFHASSVNETFPWFFLGFYIFFLFYFTCPRWILNPVELKSIESHWIAKNLKSWQFGLTILKIFKWVCQIELPDFMAEKLSQFRNFESNTERPLIPFVVSVIFTVLLIRFWSCCIEGQPMHLDNPS